MAELVLELSNGETLESRNLDWERMLYVCVWSFFQYTKTYTQYIPHSSLIL